MNVLINIKNIFLSVVIFGGISLCGMELDLNKIAMELQQHSDNCWLRNVLFAAHKIKKQHGELHDISGVIVQKACLVRMAEIHATFDSFFHFDNDSFHTMYSDYKKDKKRLIGGNPGINNNAVLQSFYTAQLILINETCRKLTNVEPHHLLFFTEKHDGTLLALVSRPGCVQHHKGSFSWNFTKEEYEQYKMLPPKLLELLDMFSVNIVSEQSESSDEDWQEQLWC